MQKVVIAGTAFKFIPTFGTTFFKRGSAFQVFARDYSLGLNEDVLSQALLRQEKALEERKFVEAATINGFLKTLVADKYSLRPILKLACTFILLDDESDPEDPYSISARHDAKKLQLCEANKEIEFFFVSTCIDLLKLMNVVPKDTKNEDFLEVGRKLLEEKLLAKIGTGIYRA